MGDKQVKTNGKTIWIVLTYVLTVMVFVLAIGLYHFNRLTLTLKTQLVEMEERNSSLSGEVVRHQEETKAAENEVRTVRVMNGILQQQDGNDEWIDVASVEELESEDPVLVGRNKMQELIEKNREAVQNGTAEASRISPLVEGKRTSSDDTLASSSSVKSVTEKSTTHISKPNANNTAPATTTPAAPAATQPTAGTDNTSGGSSDGGSSDSGSSYSTPSDSGNSGGGSSGGGSSDSGSSDSGSSDSGSSDSGSSDSGSSESGDGEDIGWTEDIL